MPLKATTGYPGGVTRPLSFLHRFPGFDPWQNLAREEILFDDLPAGASTLVLYVNSPCVVLGKHQNPFREVRLAEAAARGVPLVRRASGGGTVWHDEGNLNWSYLGPKSGYDRTAVSQAVAAALVPLGAALTIGEKGDLFQEGKKVSGAAYLIRRDRVLHHGTLLCRARLEALRGVLGPTGVLSEWVGVASRPMPVANLELDIGQVSAALTRALAPGVAGGDGGGPRDFEERVSARAAGLRTAAWLWDQTPPFTWEGATLQGPLKARVRDGRIEEAWDDRSRIMSNMVGKRFFDPELFEYIPREVV